MSLTNKNLASSVSARAVLLSSILASAFAAGCAVDATPSNGGQAPESVASTNQALTGLVVKTWQGTLNHLSNGFTDGASNNLDMGVGAGWTCWVAGVRGNLEQTGAVSVMKNTGGVPGVPDGNWVLGISGLPLQTVSGTAVCAPATYLGTTNFWPTTQGAFTDGNVLTNANANSWCGLGEIVSNSLPPYVWTSPSSFATVSNNGLDAEPVVGNPTWTFSERGANAAPTCASSPSGVNGIWFYHIEAPANGTASFAMLDQNKAILPAGTACFLTSVEGIFTADNVNDGIGANIDFATHAWTMTATNGKSGWALCIH
jgi:hypothetical protein